MPILAFEASVELHPYSSTLSYTYHVCIGIILYVVCGIIWSLLNMIQTQVDFVFFAPSPHPLELWLHFMG